MDGSDPEVLREKIGAAEDNHIDAELIAQAKEVLIVVEFKAYQVAVTQKLLEARETRIIHKLQAAIDEAITAQIDETKIMSAKELLTYWKFSAFLPHGDIEASYDAILEAEASGVHGLMVVEALQHAVQDADASPTMDAGYLMLAKKLLKMLDDRVNRQMASSELWRAIPGESVEELQRAVLGG